MVYHSKRLSRKLIMIALLCIATLSVHWYYDIFAVQFNIKVVEEIPANCSCTDKYGIEYNFCYINPNNSTMIGKRFNCKHLEAVKELGLFDTNYIDLSNDDMPDPQFVAALSSNHIHEGRRQLKNLHSLWPTKKIVVFDMGLGQYRKEYENSSLIDLRTFPFSKYPSNVEKLFEYKWKPIIIVEMLKEFGSIFYIDASIVFKDADLSPVYNLLRCKNSNTRVLQNVSIPKYVNTEKINAMLKECNKSSYLFLIQTDHSNFAATHPEEKRECMGPPGSKIPCDYKDPLKEYGHCHRYDQSAVSILSKNLFNGDDTISNAGFEGYFIIDRF